MRLWVLHRIGKVRFDEASGFVIRAKSEAVARTWAASQAGDEGQQVWLDPARATCEPIAARGEPGIVLKDFNAA